MLAGEPLTDRRLARYILHQYEPRGRKERHVDWLTWRRTRDNQGYTPLDQIGPDNVAGPRLAWALAMPDGTNQTAPLVHDGVMFLASPGNVVQALDATTGELLWEHRHQYPKDAESRRATRSIALYRDKVYLATYDAAIVALDARTGEPV